MMASESLEQFIFRCNKFVVVLRSLLTCVHDLAGSRYVSPVVSLILRECHFLLFP